VGGVRGCDTPRYLPCSTIRRKRESEINLTGAAIRRRRIAGHNEPRAQVELLGAGSGLHWEALDVDLSVPGLLAGLFGTKAYPARRAGSATRSFCNSH
jgi:hypothetical protein